VEIKRLKDKEARLYETIFSLEKDIQSHKKEIREREETITDKEKRIYDLKKKNQELEKFRCVSMYLCAVVFIIIMFFTLSIYTYLCI
jgi:septal ring factor EnvC (AmiA/AmiB activator)